ncbi:MAG: hypothetical protein KAR06_01890 [Deltaproteobacteria bacterium]|nr:hypothetical protein [Deltaproteobacteria bacterium]
MGSRYYQLKDYELASVTTVIGACMDKSTPLMYWATNCMEKYLGDRIELFMAAAQMENQETGIKTIMDLLEQAKKNFRSVSKEARDIGSDTHAAIEAWLRNEPHDVPDRISKPYHAAVQWFVDNDVEVLAIEKTVYSEKEWWAGTQDLKIKVVPTWADAGANAGKECIYVIDNKTSKAFYEPDMPVQVNTYAAGEGNEDVDGTGVLRLDKETGTPFFKDYTATRAQDYVHFLCLRNAFYIAHAKKGVRLDFLNNYSGVMAELIKLAAPVVPFKAQASLL